MGVHLNCQEDREMTFRALRDGKGNRVVYLIKNIVTKATTECKAFLDSDNNICLMNGFSFVRLVDLKNDGVHKVVALV